MCDNSTTTDSSRGTAPAAFLCPLLAVRRTSAVTISERYLCTPNSVALTMHRASPHLHNVLRFNIAVG